MKGQQIQAIAAGIVTHEPHLERLRSNLERIAPQVDVVVVFDNGSSNVEHIRTLVGSFSTVQLIAESKNLGIAFALNRLAEYASARGYDGLVTLDQDSVSPFEMVKTLAANMSEGVAIVTPYIVDRNKLTEKDYRALDLPAVERYLQPARRGAITSGSLVRLKAWSDVDGFDERFFIDYVDYDFNQRILRAGYHILRANQTYLLHEVGSAARTWLVVPRRDLAGRWRLETFHSFGHSASRCYYKARNRVLFTRKHWRQLGVTHEGVWQIPQQVALTLFFENDRLSKLRAFLCGLRDGVRMPLD